MYFIIAGPQSAGKSTTIRNLAQLFSSSPDKKTSNAIFLEEERQRIGRRNNLMGAIYMTAEQERDVVDSDLTKMQQLSPSELYIDESNIFTLAHANLHGIRTNEHFKDYCLELKRLNPRIIFLDVHPETSWARRNESYRKRVLGFPESQQGKVMQNYQDYIQAVYPNLREVYDRIPFSKTIVDASKSFRKTIKQIIGKINNT